jgi:hypothetical protein
MRLARVLMPVSLLLVALSVVPAVVRSEVIDNCTIATSIEECQALVILYLSLSVSAVNSKSK